MATINNLHGNMFNLGLWAASDSTESVVAVDEDTGDVTVSAMGLTANTGYGEGSGHYCVLVDPGTKYHALWTQTGEFARAGLRWVALDENMDYIYPGGSDNPLRGLVQKGPGDYDESFTTPDGCRYVQLVFSVFIYSADEVRSGVATFRNVRLLRPAELGVSGTKCTPMMELPFTPICSRPDIVGSTAMTLEVPVPSFAPVVPPEDCVCLEFAQGSKTITPDFNCAKPSVELTLDIKPGEDCCDGKYTITPQLSMNLPCVPFEIKDAVINVVNRSGDVLGRGIDGGVTRLGLDVDCCNVTPVIDVTMPDCVKYFNPDHIPDAQISFCERQDPRPDGSSGGVARKSAKLIEMVQDPKNCSLYPRVIPLELPCCSLADDEYEQTLPLVAGGDVTNENTPKIILKWSRENCADSFDLQVTPISLPSLTNFCLNDGGGTVTLDYKDLSGKKYKDVAVTGTGTDGSVTLSSQTDPNTGCKSYSLAMKLDMTNVNMGIGNGGPVFSSSTDHNLYLDASRDDEAHTWHAGGLGNAAVDLSSSPLSRGPLAIPAHCCFEDLGVTCTNGGGPSVDVPVPYITNTDPYRLVADQTYLNGQYKTATTWASGVRKKDATGDGVQIHYPDNNSTAGGNLDVMLPTGFQWSPYGLALNLTTFKWSQNGLLSEVDEGKDAALVSPAPSLFCSNLAGTGYANYSSLAGKNASGLAVFSETPGIEHGLTVKTGDGLRIFGVDNPSEVTTADINAGKVGQLEVKVNSGKGLGFGTGTDAGKLEVKTHSGDFKFISSTDIAENGKLVLNDEKTSSTITPYTGTADGLAWGPYTRNSDLMLPVVTAALSVQPPPGTTATSGWAWVSSGKYWAVRVSAAQAQTQQVSLLWGTYNQWAGNTGTYEDQIANLKTLLSHIITVIQGLDTAVMSALDSLGTLRLCRMAFGKAGMLMQADRGDGSYASWSASGISRHSTAPAAATT